MAPDPTTPAGLASRSDMVFSRALGAMSVFTMLMTIPQVLTIWVGHQAGGVLLWFAYGLQKRDKNIYLPCVGWVGLDLAVIVGTAVYA